LAVLVEVILGSVGEILTFKDPRGVLQRYRVDSVEFATEPTSTAGDLLLSKA